MKNTVFCFYKNSDYLVSDDFITVACPSDKDLKEFLTEIQNNFSSAMKVVQINFEAGQNCFSHQQELYPAAKATVFILNSYNIIDESALVKKLTHASEEEITFESLELKSAFVEKVNIIKREIAAGRLYQANLTAALRADTNLPAEAIFTKYFSNLTGKYKAVLPLGNDCSIICFSPEMFLQKEGSVLKTRPIKGSLKSGENFESELISDKKEEAELSMIVDLLRNDLNRIDPESSAVVTKHRAPMQLGYIQHTYSEVEINTEKSLPEILESTLPGGSISGCPKLESLILIAELETYKRQVYTGTIGWWQGNEFTLNLAIRTFIKNNNSLYYHAGCGIVYDSIAEKEWDEFILKTGRINARF